MGRPTAGDRITRLSEKLKPRTHISGAFTQAQLDALDAAGYTVYTCLWVPGRMDPDTWTKAVAEFQEEQEAMAKRKNAAATGCTLPARKRPATKVPPQKKATAKSFR